MKCRVTPIGGRDVELSYRVKCVAVESERVFGDVIVTHQRNTAELLPIYWSKRQNLVRQYLEGPNLLELNRQVDLGTRRQSIATLWPKQNIKAQIDKLTRSKSLEYSPTGLNYEENDSLQGTWTNCNTEKKRKMYPSPSQQITVKQEIMVSSLVNQLLVDIYGSASGGRSRSESESTNSSWKSRRYHRPYLQKTRLDRKCISELRVLLGSLREHISHTGALLIRQLRRRDYLQTKREKLYDVVTAHLQAHSSKRSEDTRMKFSLTPQPGESGFIQWLDAMKMVAKLQGGIPAEFRRKLWLTLAERHLEQRGVDWLQAEKLCFNEWSNPDDEELGIQIVKDLHRTGCSLFCGAAGRNNQAVLRRVLLGFARWNKSVGYCQGLNVLAALILQVVDRDEAAAVKVMIHLIEGVLPEGYFADSLKGLSVDMAVFRDILRMRLPKLSRHLESLQNETKDKATGSSYEPPLTNVFTMQWFLTLFCHCLPQDAVLRVWDLIFLEGDDVLLRTALAIWEGLSNRIMTVTSADEFYSIMGVLTREMLEFTDTNNLVKTIVSIGTLPGVTSLREKHRYNITPWARRLSDDEDSDTEDDERLAVATAAAIFAMPRNKKSDRSPLQTIAPSSDRERLALDISMLKQQYVKLRERQRQAHIILSAACARQSMVPISSASQTMNHLLVGKSALVSNKNRPIGSPSDSSVTRAKAATLASSPRNQNRKERQQQGITIHWKDMKKHKDELGISDTVETSVINASTPNFIEGALPGLAMTSTNSTKRLASTGGGGTVIDSDSDSTSTELCDEPDRLSDVDSEELTSTSEYYVMKKNTVDETTLSCVEIIKESTIDQQFSSSTKTSESFEAYTNETSIAEITDQIRRLSADDADFKTCLNDTQMSVEKKSSNLELCAIDDIAEEKRSTASVLFNTNYLIKGMKSTDLELYDDNYFIEKKKLTVLESLNINYPIPENKSTILTLSDNEYLTKDKMSKISRPNIGYPIKDYKSTSMELNNSCSFNEGKSTISEIFDEGKSIKNKELSTSMVYNVDPFIEENKLIQVSKSLNDHIDAVNINLRTKNMSLSTSLSKDSDYKCDSLESQSRINMNETANANKSATIENVASKINESINASRNLSDNYELTNAEVKYSTRSSYVIGHLPISPINLEMQTKSNCITTEVIISREEANSMKDRLEHHTFVTSMDTSALSSDKKLSIYKIQVESKNSPESIKSFDSGEMMGPDSITSSAILSLKSSLYPEFCDSILANKSIISSISSESKTLTIGSVDSEIMKKYTETSGESSVTTSTDSFKQLKSTDPPYSSTDSFCSSIKLKSSDRSLSSELQSSISANSIKYIENYIDKGYERELQKAPSEIGSVTSPFYPILNPNKKTPSPCTERKNLTDRDVVGLNKFQDNVKRQGTKHQLESRNPNQAFDIYELKNSEDNFNIKVLSENDSFNNSLKQYSYDKLENYSKIMRNKIVTTEETCNSDLEVYHMAKFKDKHLEMDTLSPLPDIQFDHCCNLSERTRGCSLDGKIETLQISGKSRERSISSLDKRFPDILSPSIEDFANNVNKRSSNVLEDLRHLEMKTTEDGEIDPKLLTRKTSFIWEDLRSLEARRQDTFSDSASSFSRQKIDVPGHSISIDGRKTYIVEPKINIDDSSDSILKTITYKSSIRNNYNDEDEQIESKLGVWTKVKPRKHSDSGRRSSDRALKIIQENSAILQKILTCQARKRLPDLEEISKEITISPINDEISKIFSPILEKMGLNEDEINEKLAKINLKDFDRNTTTTTVSEFDSKINDELSKLSLIGDNDEVAYLPDFDDISSDYLVARDAFIDHQINEELSKLLVNYEDNSSSTFRKSSIALNVSDNLSTSTNVHSYRSSNDCFNIKTEHSSNEPINSEVYLDNPLPYMSHDEYLTSHNLLMYSDVDLHSQVHKLDQTSYTQTLPIVNTEVSHQDIISSTISYVSNVDKSAKIDYSTSVIEKQPNYNISPLKSSSNSTYTFSTLQASTYDYKSRKSPRKMSRNPYSVRLQDSKGSINTEFENSTFELTSRETIVPTTLNYEYESKKHILSKENLEFPVKYNQNEKLTTSKTSTSRNIDLRLSPFQTAITKFGNDAPYYSNKQIITPTIKYEANQDTNLSLISTLETSNHKSAYKFKKYENVSPAEKYSLCSEKHNIQRQPWKTAVLESKPKVSLYLTDTSVTNINCHQDIQVLTPRYNYSDREKEINSSYKSISPVFDNFLIKTTTTATTMTTTVISKTTYSDTFTDRAYRKPTLTLGNFEQNKQMVDNDTKYNFDESLNPKTLGFSPFPSRNSPRKPKELALKLGLYSPTKISQSKKS